MVVEIPEPLGLGLRGNLEEGGRFEPPDVRVCVKDLQIIEIPTEMAHVEFQLVRGLLEGDEETAFTALEAFSQELDAEDRLPGARGTRDDVGASGDETTM
jgi:hypothetical protein